MHLAMQTEPCQECSGHVPAVDAARVAVGSCDHALRRRTPNSGLPSRKRIFRWLVVLGLSRRAHVQSYVSRQTVVVIRPPTNHGRFVRSPLFALASLALLANALATALAPALVSSHPVWLIVLDARNRHLALASGAGVGAVPFFAIGLIRGLAFDPVFFALGRTRRDTAVRWLEARSRRSARALNTIMSVFERFGTLLMLVSPNSAVCLAAGVSEMRWRRFLVVDIISTMLQVTAVWVLGAQFRQPLSALVAYISSNAVALTMASSAFVVVVALRDRRRRRRQFRDNGVAAELPVSMPKG